MIVSTHIVSDIENMATHLAILRQGRLLAFSSPEALVAAAEGQVWTALLEPGHYEALRRHVHVLQTQRQGRLIQVRMAHAERPCAEAQATSPSLEEALMAQRYADTTPLGLAA